MGETVLKFERPAPPHCRVQWNAFPLDVILKRFTDDFKLEAPFTFEWWLDPVKQEVVFRLFVEEINRPKTERRGKAK